MKRRVLFIALAIFVCGILSILTEVFIFNFKSLTLSDSDQSIPEVSFTTEKDNDKTQLKLNIDTQYVRKLIIDYTAPEDVNYTIDYTFTGAYGLDNYKTFEDIFENTFTVVATNIDANVSEMAIIYNNTSSNLQINKISIDNNFYFNYCRAALIFLALSTIVFLFVFYKDGFRTEKIHIYFAIIGTLLGLMIIVAQPAMTFYCWDGQTHFDRVVRFFPGTQEFNIGEFNMSDGTTANHNWYASTNSYTEYRNRSAVLDTESITNYAGGNYDDAFLIINKIPYLPMAIGYHGSKLLGLPFTIYFTIGKIFNLLFYILLMTYAIKTLVTGKRLLAIIAFLPSNIFLACQYSYDPAVFTGITIFIVHIVNLLLDKSAKLDFKTALIMITSLTYACLAKAAYAPIALLFLLIPKNKFQSIKQSYLVKTGFVAITILLLSILILPTLNGIDTSDTRGGEVSVSDQLSNVISYPFDYASILGNSAIGELWYKLFSPDTLTNFSYAHSFKVIDNCYYVFLFLLLFIFFTDNHGNKLAKKQRSYLLGINLLLIIIIWSALYVNFTPVGATTINGVQNRYFLPLLLPILLALQFPNIQSRINPKYYNFGIFALASITTIIMVYTSILIPYNF